MLKVFWNQLFLSHTPTLHKSVIYTLLIFLDVPLNHNTPK